MQSEGALLRMSANNGAVTWRRCTFFSSVHLRNPSKRGETFGISRIGSKIKGVFKSTTMEGAMLPPSAMNDFDDDQVTVLHTQVLVPEEDGT